MRSQRRLAEGMSAIAAVGGLADELAGTEARRKLGAAVTRVRRPDALTGHILFFCTAVPGARIHGFVPRKHALKGRRTGRGTVGVTELEAESGAHAIGIAGETCNAPPGRRGVAGGGRVAVGEAGSGVVELVLDKRRKTGPETGRREARAIQDPGVIQPARDRQTRSLGADFSVLGAIFVRGARQGAASVER